MLAGYKAQMNSNRYTLSTDDHSDKCFPFKIDITMERAMVESLLFIYTNLSLLSE